MNKLAIYKLLINGSTVELYMKYIHMGLMLRLVPGGIVVQLQNMEDL